MAQACSHVLTVTLHTDAQGENGGKRCPCERFGLAGSRKGLFMLDGSAQGGMDKSLCGAPCMSREEGGRAETTLKSIVVGMLLTPNSVAAA